MHERSLAILLFSGVAVLIWIGFLVFVASPETGAWLQVGVGIAIMTATAFVSAWLAPTLTVEAQRGANLWKGAYLGAFIVFASYAIAAVLLAVGITLVATVGESGFTVRRAFESVLFIAYLGFAGAITILSPGLVLGAAAGALFYRITRSLQTRAPESPPEHSAI